MFDSIETIWNTPLTNLGDIFSNYIDNSSYSLEYIKLIFIKSLYRNSFLNSDDIGVVEDVLNLLIKFDEKYSSRDKFNKTLNEALDMVKEFIDIPSEDNIPTFEFRSVNGYIIIKFLGSGVSSNVFKVVCDGKFYAMKEYLNIADSDSFIRECTSLSSFCSEESTGIIKMVNNFILTNFYIITEYLDGYTTLLNYIRSINIHKSEKDGINLGIIINKIGETIKYMHSNGIAHRDIKPENIMVNPDNLDVKLIDFGISCNSNNIKSSRVGTILYQDIMLNEKYNYTIENLMKSDLWSFGITIFLCIYEEQLYDVFYNQIYLNQSNSIYGILWERNFKHRNYSTSKIDVRIRELFVKYYDYNDPQFAFEDFESTDEIIEKIGITSNLHHLLCRDLDIRHL